VPRAFHESGVVLSIALTFVPQTFQSLKRIREAQAVRGHQVRGLRDWLPILTPLFVSALERALGLAEALVARGYAASAGGLSSRTRGLLVLGLVALLGGWLTVLLVPSARVAAFVALGLGGLSLAIALWQVGQNVQHTVYRPRRWQLRDTLFVIACLPALILVLTHREALYYSPYPRLTWPAFQPLIALCLLALLMPALHALAHDSR